MSVCVRCIEDSVKCECLPYIAFVNIFRAHLMDLGHDLLIKYVCLNPLYLLHSNTNTHTRISLAFSYFLSLRIIIRSLTYFQEHTHTHTYFRTCTNCFRDIQSLTKPISAKLTRLIRTKMKILFNETTDPN